MFDAQNHKKSQARCHEPKMHDYMTPICSCLLLLALSNCKLLISYCYSSCFSTELCVTFSAFYQSLMYSLCCIGSDLLCVESDVKGIGTPVEKIIQSVDLFFPSTINSFAYCISTR